MFLHLSAILFMGEGVYTPLGRHLAPGETPLPRRHPPGQTPPLWADTPSLGRNTPQIDTPLGRYPLGRHTPRQTPLRQTHPQADTPWADIPPGQAPPPRWQLKRVVRILLECILVNGHSSKLYHKLAIVPFEFCHTNLHAAEAVALRTIKQGENSLLAISYSFSSDLFRRLIDIPCRRDRKNWQTSQSGRNISTPSTHNIASMQLRDRRLHHVMSTVMS